MIARSLGYLKICKGKGIMIVPEWHSAYYWPMISHLLENEKRYTRGVLKLGDIFTHYRNKNSLFGSSQWNATTLAISIDFSRS